MDKSVDPSWLHLAWTMVMSLVVALVALGSFRAKLATKDDLKKSEDGMLKRLYRDDGATVYMPRADCDKSQSGCATRVCLKLDEMRADIQRRHEEDIETQREHLRRHDEIAEFVGSVRQFMHQKKEG